MTYSAFKNIAPYYDALYVKEDQYRLEAQQVRIFAQQHKRSNGDALLDVACGTAGHLVYLQEWYDVAGLDLSDEMLSIARGKLPHVPFHHANMMDFSLKTRFDVVVCMYGSIGFAHTLPNLRRTVKNMAHHLVQGGILIVVPWETTEEFGEKIVADLVKKPIVQVARMENVRRKTRRTVEVTMHHLVGTGGDVRYYKCLCKVGLFSEAEYRSAFERAGVQLVERYRGPQIKMGAFVGRCFLS